MNRLSESSAQPGLSVAKLKRLKLTVPSKSEQQKIAEFLSGVDEWIENLRGQKESLESYKKGMMQKIFSQEIRFKDDKGNEFPKWEEKKLGEIGGTYNGLTGKAGDDFGGSDIYPTVEEKAANLLYFIIKNHPFLDGNKRSGAYAFIWFLAKAKVLDLTRLTPPALTAITLLVAESHSSNKDKMIGLVLTLLVKGKR